MQLSFINGKFMLQGVSAAPASDWLQSDRGFIPPSLREAARFKEYAKGEALKIFDKLSLKPLPLPLGGLLSPIKLLNFQEERGVPFILSRNRSYLAHQPGLGKSAQYITAVNSKPGKADVICPSFLKTNWAREITKWTYKDFPEIEIVPETEKRHETNWSADFLICSASMLQKSWVREGFAKRRAKFLAIDEAHAFKNHESKRTVALFGGRAKGMESPGMIYNAEHVVALSGTPVLNRPMELWPVLWAMAPEVIDYMNYHEFGFRYCGPRQNEHGHWLFVGSCRELELRQRLQRSFMQRITKEEVLPDLPAKTREVVAVDADPRPKDQITFDSECLAKLKLDKRREVPDGVGEYARVRHQIGVAKMQWAADFVRFYLENSSEESILLFAYHVDVVEGLAAALKAFHPAVIRGGIANEIRTRIEDEFQTGRRRLIVGNIQAMNLGLTLTRATRVVFAEYDWTPANNEQAEDRAHRIGKKGNVYSQYLVLPGSLDERVLERLLEKQSIIRGVIG